MTALSPVLTAVIREKTKGGWIADANHEDLRSRSDGFRLCVKESHTDRLLFSLRRTCLVSWIVKLMISEKKGGFVKCAENVLLLFFSISLLHLPTTATQTTSR